MLLQTRYVGHAIDVLQMMLRYPKKSVPLGKTCSLRELTVATRWIPPPGLNPATIGEDVRRLQEMELQGEGKRPLARGVVEWRKRAEPAGARPLARGVVEGVVEWKTRAEPAGVLERRGKSQMRKLRPRGTR